MVIKDLKRPFNPSPPRMVVLTPRPLEMRPHRSPDEPPAGKRVAKRELSPTTSVTRLFITLAIALVVSVLFTARGIIHSGEGMASGPAQTVTLTVGHAALGAAEFMHLTGPWDQVEVALGHKSQPALPPLLASAFHRVSSLAAHPGAASHALHRPAHSRIKPVHVSRPLRLRARSHASKGLSAHPARIPTAANPLRLLVTGDSLSGYLGPELIDEASRVGPVRGFVDTHDGTGLTRPDFVDWSVVARQQVVADNPDAVIVLMGGNDFQNMTLPGGQFFAAGTPRWTREYQRRAAICMRIWSGNGTRRVYWLSMPPARDPTWAHDDAQINIALQRAAARVPGAAYVNILGPITNQGQYADFVSINGQPTLIREPDGVHLNIEGSTLVAHEVLPVLVHDWRLRVPRSMKRDAQTIARPRRSKTSTP